MVVVLSNSILPSKCGGGRTMDSLIYGDAVWTACLVVMLREQFGL